MARDLIVSKDEIRALEREGMTDTLARLRDGTVASIESSAVHLDVIRELERSEGHVAAVG